MSERAKAVSLSHESRNSSCRKMRSSRPSGAGFPALVPDDHAARRVVRLHGKTITWTRSLKNIFVEVGVESSLKSEETREEVEEGNLPGDKFSEEPQVLRIRKGNF